MTSRITNKNGMEIDLDAISQPMREAVEELARAGRSQQRIIECTGIPGRVVQRALFDMILAEAAE